MDKEKIKLAHLKRAKEMYDNPETETPGSFEEFLQGQYVDEYGKASKPKKNPNAAVTDRYLAMLSKARGGDVEEKPGLLAAIQQNDKGPYPANAKEDEHLLEQIMKFIYSEKIQDSIFKMLKSANKNLAQLISQTAANVSAKLIFEARKQREVTEGIEAAVLRISVEELWTLAKNLGLKQINKEIVDSSTKIAQSYFDELEKQVKGKPQQQPQQAGLLGGMQ